MPEMTSNWQIWWLIVLAVLAPLAFHLGRVHKRRRGKGYTMKQQLKNLAFATVLFGLGLLAAIVFADTPQKAPLLASAVRSGGWRLSGKEIALPQGPLCQTHAVITGRHVTLKVAGAHVFEATLAIAQPQHKQGNSLSVFVDNEEVENVHILYGQDPYRLRIPLEGKQTLTLSSKYFPKITVCNPRLS
jgi:hypothetical protein